MNKIKERNEDARTGQQFAELLCDFMFKRLFGSEANKDVLIGFLNMLLKDVEIVDVDFIPTEHLGQTEEDRKVVFDISCICKDGRSFIIEMQKGYQKHFRERAVYYTTYPINEQGRHAHDLYLRQKAEAEADGVHSDLKFKWDYNLKPVTVIAILNFQFSHDDSWPKDRYHSSYRLREDRDPLFTRLFLLAEINTFTAEEYKQYKKSLENMSELDNIINSTAELAEIRGREEGRKEGIYLAVKRMLDSGMSTEQVAAILQMSIDQVCQYSEE